MEKVAEDIVTHFTGRGFQGKAMVISIDKATAVRMYDKVQKHWVVHLEKLRSESARSPANSELIEKIHFMEETGMAVVVSQSQNEIEDFRDKGLDILPHRKRMVKENLDEMFKDPNNPFRMVFVCAMWITGFDVPSCSTIYLDKPMRNHTLMQTIARANRVFPQKHDGLIVDYVGVFRDLQKALAIYGSSVGGGIDEGDSPIKDKDALFEELRQAIDQTTEFCKQCEIDLARIQLVSPLEKVKLIDEAVESILVSDESKKKFIALAVTVNKLYKAILPDERADKFTSARTLFLVLLESIKSLTPAADISEVMEDIEKLLDKSIAAEGYVIDARKPIDLGHIDFGKLRQLFEKNRKRTTTEQLKGSIEAKLKQMVAINRTRVDFLAKFQKMIDEYNSGAYNIEVFFEKLVNFARELGEEEQRAIRENLSDEELVVFDLLTKPELELNKKETEEVKKVAKDLLDTLKNEKLILDWRKKQQSRASVRLTIETVLDGLPRTYTKELYQQKCDLIYQHVYDSYFGQDSSIFAHA